MPSPISNFHDPRNIQAKGAQRALTALRDALRDDPACYAALTRPTWADRRGWLDRRIRALKHRYPRDTYYAVEWGSVATTVGVLERQGRISPMQLRLLDGFVRWPEQIDLMRGLKQAFIDACLTAFRAGKLEELP